MSSRLRSLNPYELHKYLVNVYCLNKKGSTRLLQRDSSRDRTDLDVVRAHHRFLWDEHDQSSSWEQQLARKYYDKLFKEYCICDLSRYKENKVALRWRTEREVAAGTGQFSCASKQCAAAEHLRTWEVNFCYSEHGEQRNALVKLRLCPECSDKLNYRSKKREVKRLKRGERKKKKKKRKEGSGSDGTAGEELTEECDQPPASTETATARGGDGVGDGAGTHIDEQADSLWKKDAAGQAEEKSREDEFQEYLDELLL